MKQPNKHYLSQSGQLMFGLMVLLLYLPPMFGFFKKKKPQEPVAPAIFDINGSPIEVGMKVKCLRYDLGECTVELEGREYFYVSIGSGERVSFTRMFDAATKNQKVEVI